MKIILPSFPVEGGCLCNAVRYALNSPPLGVYNCHCSDCRRSSGAAYTMSMVVKRPTVTLLKGKLSAFDKRADSGRVVRMLACSRCGIKIWNEPLSFPDLLILKPGTLDDMSWAIPIGNIWTASRAPWTDIDPGLVNFDGRPPAAIPSTPPGQARQNVRIKIHRHDGTKVPWRTCTPASRGRHRRAVAMLDRPNLIVRDRTLRNRNLPREVTGRQQERHHGQRTEDARRAVSRHAEGHLFRREEDPSDAAEDGEGRAERGTQGSLREAPRRDRGPCRAAGSRCSR